MAIDYMINLQKAGLELAEGQLVLIQLDTTRNVGGGFSYGTAVGKVLEYRGGNAIIDVEGRGKIKAAMPRENQSGLGLPFPARELELLAINTLKTEDAASVLAYLDTISTSKNGHPVAFHVSSATPGGAIRGRLIGENADQDIPMSGDQLIPLDSARNDDQLPMGLEAIRKADVTYEIEAKIDGFGNLIGATPSDMRVSKGDILVARNFAVEITGGAETIRLVNVAVVGNTATTEEAVAYLGLETDRPNRSWRAPSLSGLGEIIHIYEIGVSCTQPDKALAIFFDDPLGKRQMALLGSSGYHAFVNEELQCYLEGAELEPGLWTMHNLRNVSHTDHEGNWDADVEGDWLPATAADVEELFGPVADLDGELAEVMEIDPEFGLGVRMMEAAVVARFEEDFAEEHKKFAMRRFGIVDEAHWSVRQVVNPAAIEAYAAAPFNDIADERIRNLASKLLVREIKSRSSQFVSIVATEAERAELAKEVNWGKHKPLLFLPNETLDADRDAFSSAVHAMAASIAKNLDAGLNLAAMNVPQLMRKLSRESISAEGLPVFSAARHVEGNWHFAGRDKKWITLALFVGETHVATLKTDMHRHFLTNPWGLNITAPYQDSHDTAVRIAVRDIVLAADRAVCEIEARHWRDHDHADLCSPTRDGIHTRAHSIAYIADGVLHREDGPSLQQGPFFADENPMMEHRFRGNLHRLDGPAMYQGDFSVWYRHGLEHRTNGPSTDLGGGDVEYRLFDELHREDGPAIEGLQGKSWYLNNRLHRAAGPAMVNANGEFWYRHGMYHREDGPALSFANGEETYFVNAVLHNESGPAFIGADGERRYALNGVEIDEAEFLSGAASTAMSPTAKP